MTNVISGRLLVVGGASGMGEAVVELAKSRYDAVTILDVQKPDPAKAADNVNFFETDITDYEAVLAGVSEARDSVAVINCVGRETASRFLESGPEDWNRLIAVNLTGQINVAHAAVKLCENLESLVLVSSDAGRVGTKGQVVYSGAKAGVLGLAKGLARELAPRIRANVVCPGPTDTPLFREAHDAAPKLMDKMVAAIPLKRPARADELAEAMLYLASPASSFVNGQVLSVSGGLTMVG